MPPPLLLLLLLALPLLRLRALLLLLLPLLRGPTSCPPTRALAPRLSRAPTPPAAAVPPGTVDPSASRSLPPSACPLPRSLARFCELAAANARALAPGWVQGGQLQQGESVCGGGGRGGCGQRMAPLAITYIQALWLREGGGQYMWTSSVSITLALQQQQLCL